MRQMSTKRSGTRACLASGAGLGLHSSAGSSWPEGASAWVRSATMYNPLGSYVAAPGAYTSFPAMPQTGYPQTGYPQCAGRAPCKGLWSRPGNQKTRISVF